MAAWTMVFCAEAGEEFVLMDLKNIIIFKWICLISKADGHLNGQDFTCHNS